MYQDITQPFVATGKFAAYAVQATVCFIQPQPRVDMVDHQRGAQQHTQTNIIIIEPNSHGWQH